MEGGLTVVLMRRRMRACIFGRLFSKSYVFCTGTPYIRSHFEHTETQEQMHVPPPPPTTRKAHDTRTTDMTNPKESSVSSQS